MSPRFALLGIAVCFAAGACAPPAQIPAETNEEAPRKVDVAIPAEYADLGIALVRNEKRVRVGDPQAKAFEAFPRPRGGYEVSERPPFLSDVFASRGWETSAETFNIVEKNGRVVLALYTLENGDRQQTDEFLMEHERALPSTALSVVPGAHADYWFWEAGGQRAMVCRASDQKGRKVVAAAVGDARIMTLFRMDPASARQDQLKLDTLFRKTGTGP